MTHQDTESEHWTQLQQQWSAQEADGSADRALVHGIRRHVRRTRALWWLEGAAVLAGGVLATSLALQGRLSGIAGVIVAVLLLGACSLSAWSLLARRAAWRMGTRNTEDTLRAALSAARASTRFWQVNRVLTWVAGVAFSLFVLAGVVGLIHPDLPVAMAYSPLLVLPLCLLSDVLTRARLKSLRARSERLRLLVRNLGE
ncbi:hypothetical protein [Lysobacter sp. A3-1-A15]